MRLIIFGYLLSALFLVSISMARAETGTPMVITGQQGTLEKGVPYCLTDDLLAKFNMATADNFPYEQSANPNDTVKDLEQSGNCAVNERDAAPITILGTDEGKEYSCGDSTCTAGGGLIFIRISLPEGKTKEVWVNSGTPEILVTSSPHAITMPKETDLCPTLSLHTKFFLASLAGSTEKKKSLIDKGCSVTNADTTMTVTVLKITDKRHDAYLSASYPDGTTHNFWTFCSKELLPDECR